MAVLQASELYLCKSVGLEINKAYMWLLLCEKGRWKHIVLWVDGSMVG